MQSSIIASIVCVHTYMIAYLRRGECVLAGYLNADSDVLASDSKLLAGYIHAAWFIQDRP